MATKTKDNDDASCKITSITIRANKGWAPFQHVRVEITASVVKGRAKEARELLVEELHNTMTDAINVLSKGRISQALNNEELDYSNPDDNDENKPIHPF
jgi:hypothetical protein